LNATDVLGDEARKPRIAVKVEEISLKRASRISVLTALDRMEVRGLIQSVQVPPAEEGGRRSYYYKLTPNSKFALSQAKLAAREVTDAIGDLI